MLDTKTSEHQKELEDYKCNLPTSTRTLFKNKVNQKISKAGTFNLDTHHPALFSNVIYNGSDDIDPDTDTDFLLSRSFGTRTSSPNSDFLQLYHPQVKPPEYI